MLLWGAILARRSTSPRTKFIIMDWAASSRLWPVARYLAPMERASSFISIRRKTPQYVHGLLLPDTGATASIVTPSSENDLRWNSTPLSLQNLLTISTLGGR